MGYFLIRRTLGFVLTLLAVSVVVFAVMNVLPGRSGADHSRARRDR